MNVAALRALKGANMEAQVAGHNPRKYRCEVNASNSPLVEWRHKGHIYEQAALSCRYLD